MGYAILRTQKLKSGIAVKRSLQHAFREQETPNADPSRTLENTHIGAADVDEALARFNARLPDKVRKNAVLAVEYLITASPEDMQGKTREQQDAYFRDGLDWLKRRHGAENVVYAGIHRDESTPHMYAYVVPLDRQGKLNCRSFLGGAKALSEMQTEFAQEVGQQHGLQRGIEGSKARHTSIQQYYRRVHEAFEPLPRVNTPAPKLRPEPEKPGLFAGSDAKEAYRRDHLEWEKEKRYADLQRQQHMSEVKAQRDSAVEIAMRHQAQAKEAAALRAEVDQLKRSNSHYVKKSRDLVGQLGKVSQVVELLRPDEMQALQARLRQQEAERAKQAEKARQEAAEAARRAEYAKEHDRRVQDIQKLLPRGGAAHTFAVKAATALREAGGDASKVRWNTVEGDAIREAMGKHGQSAESVIKAITEHSPIRANPEKHAAVVSWVNKKAPELAQQYQERTNSKGVRLSR